MAGCGERVAQALLIFFNVIFCLSGAALLAVGIWLLVDDSVVKYFDVLAGLGSEGELLKYASYVLIAVGCFVFIVGFCGCCGAWKKNKCLLGVYIILLVIVMGLELAAGILGVIFRDKIEKTLGGRLLEAFAKKYGGTESADEAFTSAFNFAQANLKCCGVSGPSDYVQNVTGFAGEYPVSCCKLNDNANPVSRLATTDAQDYNACKAELASTATTDTNSHKNGCTDGLKMWVKEHATILIGVGIGIACLEIFGFIFAVCLCCSIGKSEDVM